MRCIQQTTGTDWLHSSSYDFQNTCERRSNELLLTRVACFVADVLFLLTNIIPSRNADISFCLYGHLGSLTPSKSSTPPFSSLKVSFGVTDADNDTGVCVLLTCYP